MTLDCMYFSGKPCLAYYNEGSKGLYMIKKYVHTKAFGFPYEIGRAFNHTRPQKPGLTNATTQKAKKLLSSKWAKPKKNL